MRVPARTVAFACVLLAAPLTHAAIRPDAAVRNVEDRWSEAFMTGDTAALDALLDPDYVSVGSSGQARSKAEILQLARDYAEKHPGSHAKPMPATSTVRVIGDAAVVRHHGDADTSVDVFYLRDGQWHAWYSQHTALKPQT
jgi:hypothetical protein